MNVLDVISPLIVYLVVEAAGWVSKWSYKIKGGVSRGGGCRVAQISPETRHFTLIYRRKSVAVSAHGAKNQRFALELRAFFVFVLFSKFTRWN